MFLFRQVRLDTVFLFAGTPTGAWLNHELYHVFGIREKLDDELPELMLTVAQLLFPQLVRPLPATSILEFLVGSID